MKTPATKRIDFAGLRTFFPGSLPGDDILSGSLSMDGDGHNSLDQCIASLREAIGANRLAIFLDSPPDARPENRLSCVGAIGIPAEIRKHAELSKRYGIGKWVTLNGKILRRDKSGSLFTATENIHVQQEFEVLNCQVAIPITDRSTTIGIALLDAPITRRKFSEEELQTIFHLMEKLGLFIRKDREEARLIFDNSLLEKVLSMLHCGALVVDRNMEIVKANSAVKDFFGLDYGMPLTFDDIPEVLAEQVRGGLQQREGQAPFFLSLPQDPLRRLLRISLSPLVDQPNEDPQLLVVILEDFSDVENARKSMLDTATSRIATQLQFLANPA